MQFLVSALGSAGDVHPFVAISQALLARGHRVRLIAALPFEARVRRAGIDFIPLGQPGEYERMLERAELWDARRGSRLLLDELLARLPESFAEMATVVAAQTATVLVGSTLSWSLRLIQETTGLPMATVHLSPLCLPSAFDPPVLPGIGDLSWLPAWAVGALQRAIERLVTDRLIAPPLNRLRDSLGLPPAGRILSRWMHSPDRIIGAWPDWFAAPQPDWPPGAVTTGFPMFDEDAALDAALEAFLAAGAPPIGITPGSAMAHGERFFAAGIDACRALGRRALLITPYRQQLPPELPDWAHAVAYAPFSRLLPRLAVLAHHGGIGTSAQALAAGIPQLVVPFAHDQFDNAARLRRLGVAVTVNATAGSSAWTSGLRSLEGRKVAAAVACQAARIRAAEAPAQLIARLLERLGEEGAGRPPPGLPAQRLIAASAVPSAAGPR